jgi:hypothetical protein
MDIGNIELTLVAIICLLCLVVAGGVVAEFFRRPPQFHRRNDAEGRPLKTAPDVRRRLTQLGVLPAGDE